jgi:hypothetical protein
MPALLKSHGPHVWDKPGLSGYLVCLVHLVRLMQPNKPDRPNRPNEQDRLANFFSILLEIPTAFDRLEQRHFVGILDIHPDRNAIGDT